MLTFNEEIKVSYYYYQVSSDAPQYITVHENTISTEKQCP